MWALSRTVLKIEQSVTVNQLDLRYGDNWPVIGMKIDMSPIPGRTELKEGS